MHSKKFRVILFSRWAAFVHDLVWVCLALFLAFWIRFNLSNIPPIYQQSLVSLILVGVPIQGASCWFFGLYRGFWRFASIPDLFRILKSVLVGTIVIAIVLWVFTRLQNIPRSVLILYPILLIGGMCLSRILYRWHKDKQLGLSKTEGTRTLIIGAGQAGEMLVRDMMRRTEYNPVVFVDDDPSKHNREIHGIPVAGGLADLRDIVTSLGIELIIFAIPSAGKSTLKEVFSQCKALDIPCQTLPSLFEMAGEEVRSERLRKITVEDLLGRDVVRLDSTAISDYLQGKRVLITGGGGSIGSELCHQVAKQNPEVLIIYDNGEFNIYTIEQILRAKFPSLHMEFILGDVKNRDRIEWLFSTFSPQVIFHAAAYKHVPIVENNPAEGVNTNIFGTKIVAEAADRYNADRFVFISTDKAVNPANVMGASKRIAELFCQNLNGRSRTKYITTRFGNVLGSAGSVVPLFQKQIEKGGPVTVTHPEITRYFMTIPEAVSLILQAGAMGAGGEIFVLDMGEPVLIKDLAEQMIRFSGLVPGQDIKIVYTGLRPGEKLFEELLHSGENLQPTSHVKLLLARCRQVDWGWLEEEFARLEQAVIFRDVDLLKKHLKNIVPEYQ
ncbi:MAG: polysaccharide biosynthesis protein [Desulforudis sp.]|jgi:FlaA1/EpsC-like NDP-sugar epimerase|nr:MAG: polysaccharide biosynthesis protein [Desulforudis sp.]